MLIDAGARVVSPGAPHTLGNALRGRRHPLCSDLLPHACVTARVARMLRGKGTKSQLSPGEKELYVKARQLLSGEIGLARGLEPAEADARIDEQLTPMGS